MFGVWIFCKGGKQENEAKKHQCTIERENSRFGLYILCFPFLEASFPEWDGCLERQCLELLLYYGYSVSLIHGIK